MQIHLEKPEIHSIQSYSEQEIKINDNSYQQSLIVSKSKLITDLPLQSLDAIKQSVIDQILNLKPDLILIGHQTPNGFLDAKIIADLSQKGIGIETMSIGAAARTFNLLIHDVRTVAALFIMPAT